MFERAFVCFFAQGWQRGERERERERERAMINFYFGKTLGGRRISMYEDGCACLYASSHASVHACSFAYMHSCMDAYMHRVCVRICMHVHASWKLLDDQGYAFYYGQFDLYIPLHYVSC